MYGLWDKELGCFKEDMEFDTEKEALEFYGDCFYLQSLEGNCGYDGYSEEEIKADLDNMTDKEILAMYDYEVVKLSQ